MSSELVLVIWDSGSLRLTRQAIQWHLLADIVSLAGVAGAQGAYWYQRCIDHGWKRVCNSVNGEIKLFKLKLLHAHYVLLE